MFLISPDKSFRGALPARYNSPGITFEEIFDAANISKGDVAIEKSAIQKPCQKSDYFSVRNGILFFDAPAVNDYRISMYRLNGQRVHTKVISASIAQEKCTVVEAKELSGVYVLEVDLGGAIHRSVQTLY